MLQKTLPIFSAMRMQHYAIFLRAFNYKIEFKKSEDNANADCLFRLSISSEKECIDVVDSFFIELASELPVTVEDIVKENIKDK